MPTMPQTKKTATARMPKTSDENTDHISAFPQTQTAAAQKQTRAALYSLYSSAGRVNPAPMRIGTHSPNQSLKTISSTDRTERSVSQATAHEVYVGFRGGLRFGGWPTSPAVEHSEGCQVDSRELKGVRHFSFLRSGLRTTITWVVATAIRATSQEA